MRQARPFDPTNIPKDDISEGIPMFYPYALDRIAGAAQVAVSTQERIDRAKRGETFAEQLASDEAIQAQAAELERQAAIAPVAEQIANVTEDLSDEEFQKVVPEAVASAMQSPFVPPSARNAIQQAYAFLNKGVDIDSHKRTQARGTGGLIPQFEEGEDVKDARKKRKDAGDALAGVGEPAKFEKPKMGKPSWEVLGIAALLAALGPEYAAGKTLAAPFEAELARYGRLYQEAQDAYQAGLKNHQLMIQRLERQYDIADAEYKDVLGQAINRQREQSILWDKGFSLFEGAKTPADVFAGFEMMRLANPEWADIFDAPARAKAQFLGEALRLEEENMRSLVTRREAMTRQGEMRVAIQERNADTAARQVDLGFDRLAHSKDVHKGTQKFKEEQLAEDRLQFDLLYDLKIAEFEQKDRQFYDNLGRMIDGINAREGGKAYENWATDLAKLEASLSSAVEDEAVAYDNYSRIYDNYTRIYGKPTYGIPTDAEQAKAWHAIDAAENAWRQAQKRADVRKGQVEAVKKRAPAKPGPIQSPEEQEEQLRALADERGKQLRSLGWTEAKAEAQVLREWRAGVLRENIDAHKKKKGSQ